MIVFTSEGNPATLKLLLAAEFSDKHLQLQIVKADDATLPAPKHLPTLVHEDRVIFMPNAAALSLFPPSEQDGSTVNEWLEWEAVVLTPTLLHFYHTNTASSQAAVEQCMKALNDFLNERCSVNVCDVVLWSTLYPFYKDGKCEHLLAQFAHVKNWLERLEREEKCQRVLAVFGVAGGAIAYQILREGIKWSPTNVSSPLDSSQADPNPSKPNVTVDGVTKEELATAKEAWLNGRAHWPRVKKEVIPVVPIEGERNILITSSLPYVNNVPHLGNIIGCVLSGDVFARFCRLCNYNTLYICGTDEYGTATETKALEEGLTPQQICDKYFAIHNAIYRWFNIGFDSFGRTTTAEQTRIVQQFFTELNHNGFMHVQSVQQLFCVKCDRSLADRFVEGGCPHPGCNREDARGDQCDGCGKLVNATELKNPKCKICNASPILRSTQEFFIDLPKLEPLLRVWLTKSATGWTYNARIIGNSWLKEGLKPRCITRDLKWGVPVPVDGFQNKVFYVWFDAPIGYISITARYMKEYEKWWRPEKNMDVKLYQFMAKDNVPFHAVMFPAVILGLNQGHTIVSHIMATGDYHHNSVCSYSRWETGFQPLGACVQRQNGCTHALMVSNLFSNELFEQADYQLGNFCFQLITEYLNYEDGKFSKSRGIGVFGNDAQSTGIPSDVWRFYLLYVRPETQDSSFCWADLATKNNSELLNNLGNFINRTLTFAEKYFDGIIPTIVPLEDDYTVLALCNRELKGYMASLEKAKLRDGIRYILNVSRHGNQYIQSTEPWVLIKGSATDKEKAGTVVGLCCNIVYFLSVLLFPYMPETSRAIRKQLNVTDEIVLNPKSPELINFLPTGHKIGKPLPLFSKIEPSRVEELKKLFAGKQQCETKQSVGKETEKSAETPILNGNGENPEMVTELQEAVNKQALYVRELKGKGVAKTEWQPHVNILLDLKKKLAAALGGVK